MAEKIFETSMQELENIISELEEGTVELDKALKLFEKGVGLSKNLRSALDKAEQKVTKLTSDDSGIPCEEPFDETQN